LGRRALGEVGGNVAAKSDQSGSYTSENIQVLEGVEHVRLRPGMYIGTTSSRGLHHLIYEVVDNSIDEAMAGSCTRIQVTLRKDGGVSVVDNGRGIPVTPIPKSKDRRPAVEVVLTTLNAGGKFGGGGYRISGGLHGVGVSVVNALSERLIVAVERDGVQWAQEHARGKATGKLQKGKPSKRTGTAVTFWADPQVFVEGIEYKREILAERLQELSFLTRGVEIILLDEREDPPVREVFRATGGLADFVKHLAWARKCSIPSPSTWNGSRRPPRSRWPSSGTTASPSSSTPSRTRSTPTRAACTRRA